MSEAEINTERTPRRIYRRDYLKPSYLVPELELRIELQEAAALVTAVLEVTPHEATLPDAPLRLDGKDLTLCAISVNGSNLPPEEYTQDASGLTLHSVPRPCTLRITTRIDPFTNRSAIGLYASGGIVTSQMEAEGFRCMTYFPDRPDVMSRYTTTIVADREKYPVLLSNGNEVTRGTLSEDPARHFVTFHDPYPKPCYLFAAVAGNLECLKDTFTTVSGRRVALEFYTEPGKSGRAVFALESLKRAMRWDEQVFGLEYDLDVLRVVSVSTFNMGAMENKGLLIFNDNALLADAATATDRDFLRVQEVVAHEYFHNYTGNRVTCRDWFQLTLKEGLTVLRDQLFSGDVNSQPVERINQVKRLRVAQFPEDAGPQAHPIRPESYIEIDNFYTATVYYKGAEVLRMLYTMLGRETFVQGVRTYLQRNDGTAASVEDFIHAMEIASGRSLEQFMRWYSQAGTPRLRVRLEFDAARRTCDLAVEQLLPQIKGQPVPEPFMLPLSVGFFDESGRQLRPQLAGDTAPAAAPERVLVVSKAAEIFSFTGVAGRPIPSLLRNFSAPVILEYPQNMADLLLLLGHDSDPFNRYEAGQRLAFEAVGAARQQAAEGGGMNFDPALVKAFGSLFHDAQLDPTLRAEALTLPSLAELTLDDNPVDYLSADRARKALIKAVALEGEERILELYRGSRAAGGGEYHFNGEAIGRRRLMNVCLSYLLQLGKPEYLELAEEQYFAAHNMNDRFAAMSLLCDTPSPATDRALQHFIAEWQGDLLMRQKWLRAQAAADHAGVRADVLRLSSHAAFDAHNPNHIRGLYGAFGYNSVHFHERSGAGYRFLADKIVEVDSFNPPIAAGLARCFEDFRRLDAERKASAARELERVLSVQGLSPGVYEIVANTLKE